MKKYYAGSAARSILRLIAAAVVLLLTNSNASPAYEWPQEIDAPRATVIIYQPQLESFEGDKLEARAAVSVTMKGDGEPVFGAVWFASRVATDREARTVTCLDVAVTAAKFPHAEPGELKKLTDLLEREIATWDIVLSLDQLLTALELAEKQQASAERVKNTPPKILFVTHPAVLILIDGTPELRKVDDSNLMRVVNTPSLIPFDPSSKRYYLLIGADWMSSADLEGGWKLTSDPPASVVELGKRYSEQVAEAQDTTEAQVDRVPEVIVSTEPAELIATDGEPKYSPIQGTDLLYVSNTESDLFMEIESQQHFILLSGRWYSSGSLSSGAWAFVPADSLPADFAEIPPESEKGGVLASVAGTQAAKEAVLDAHIPQTAGIDRDEAKLEVEYDGEPKFENIEGTDLDYALNTNKDVIRVENKYYCCDNAVWFMAADPMGPWSVCVSVPQVIYTIPPSCPVHHVRYVHVYSYTPQVVYVGYTPGYVGCYVYGPTVVYGTGYVYHGWYGPVVYHPRPVTWGFGMHYNPYTGWSFSVGFGGPHFYVGTSWGGSRGWWGPPAYRPVPVQRNIHVDNLNINRNININTRETNIYNRRTDVSQTERGSLAERAGRDVSGSRDRPSGSLERPKGPSGRKNDVFADRDGNVYRKSGDKWQQRDRTGWSPVERAGPSVDRSRTDRIKTDLNRQSQVRSRGAKRTNDFEKVRSQSSKRPGGGRRRR